MAGGVVASAAGDTPAPAALMLDLVSDIVGFNSGGGCGGEMMFKKDCTDLVRRVALFTHLLEEIRDSGDVNTAVFCPSDSASSSASEWWSDLLVALQAAKRLLLTASSFQSIDSTDGPPKRISFQFQCVTCKLEKALGKIPYDDLDIAEEVQEQVTLVRAQLRRATERFFNSRKVFNSLFQPMENEACNGDQEVTAKMDNIPEDLGSQGDESDDENKKLERLDSSSMSPEDFPSNEIDSKENENLESKDSEEIKKPDALLVPDDFLCPISLELMRDPVIVATGQTYERSYIQRWINGGNLTCPKTQQKLANLTLTPNYVLRSLITQWCAEHNINQIRKNGGSLHDDMEAIQALVCKLSSQCSEERRAAVAEIRSLSKRSTDNRILIGDAGAIPVLVNLLTTEDVTTQEHAVTSILNLSIYEYNKTLVMLAGAVPSIVQVLQAGSMEARENAAATLFSLSLADENKIIIGASGAIPALVDLLQNGSLRGKKDAATALFNLCIYQGNRGRTVRAGIIQALLRVLTDSRNSMVDEALTILSVLASNHEAKVAAVKANYIPLLVDLLRSGLPRNKENASAILLSLCKRDPENLAHINRLGAAIPLTELAKSGTERAKRKASSLLEHLHKSHH